MGGTKQRRVTEVERKEEVTKGAQRTAMWKPVSSLTKTETETEQVRRLRRFRCSKLRCLAPDPLKVPYSFFSALQRKYRAPNLSMVLMPRPHTRVCW